MLVTKSISVPTTDRGTSKYNFSSSSCVMTRPRRVTAFDVMTLSYGLIGSTESALAPGAGVTPTDGFGACAHAAAPQTPITNQTCFIMAPTLLRGAMKDQTVSYPAVNGAYLHRM